MKLCTLRRPLRAAAPAAILLGLAAAPASAQLVLGTADRDKPLYVVDLDTIRPGSFPVPANIATSYALPGTEDISLWAMTADNANRRLFYVDIGPLFAGANPSSNLWTYDYQSGIRTFIGKIANSDTGFEQSMQGLAMTSSGELYGVYNVGGTPGEGLYRIDYQAAVGSGFNKFVYAEGEVYARDLPGGEGAFDFGNLDYDPVTDRIYFVNNDSDGRGLYAFDLENDSVDFVVESPEYRRLENFDGLATGDGMAYFVTDVPGFVYAYDLVNGGPFEDFLSPIDVEGGLFAGAGYAPGLLATIPEPSSLTLAVLPALALLRRRR